MGKVKELRSLIYGKYDSEIEFAERLNWKKQRLNKITNGIKEPDIEEINALAKGLNVEVGDIIQIFLRYKSPNEQQKSA